MAFQTLSAPCLSFYHFNRGDNYPDTGGGTRAGNTTAMYALQWMHGQTFDFQKSQVKIHRARLRKVGIDIADKCNVSRHSPVFIRKAIEIEVGRVPQPSWYRQAVPLRLVA